MLKNTKIPLVHDLHRNFQKKRNINNIAFVLIDMILYSICVTCRIYLMLKHPWFSAFVVLKSLRN